MAYMSQDNNRTLLIFPDENLIPSTKNNGNFSTMHTWEQNLMVGDATAIDYPDIFLMEKVWDKETPEETIERAMSGEFRDLSLEKDGETGFWHLEYYRYYQKDYFTETLEPNITPDELELEILQNMWSEDIFKMAYERNLILPVNYKNGELTTENTKHHWSEFQIGFIYVNHEDISEKFGELNEESMEKAVEIIAEEMKIHNHYNKGNVFAYQLYEDMALISEKSELVGDISDIVQELGYELPDELGNLVAKLEYVDQNEVENFLNAVSEREEGER